MVHGEDARLDGAVGEQGASAVLRVCDMRTLIDLRTRRYQYQRSVAAAMPFAHALLDTIHRCAAAVETTRISDRPLRVVS